MEVSHASGKSTAWPPLPLDSDKHFIRLLEIDPVDTIVRTVDNGSDTPGEQAFLSCSSTIQPLEEAPDFTALSYCWGDVESVDSILCNGCLIPVRPNLLAALHQLRRRRHNVIWVDAICINQDDDEEKNQQVNFMGQVYETAKMTAIWLGAEQPHPEFVVQYLKELAKAYSAHWWFLQAYVREYGWLTYSWFTPDQLDHLGLRPWLTDKVDPLLEPLFRFFTSAWWRRSWVIQEFALSRHPCFFQGDASFSLTVLMHSLHVLRLIYGFMYHSMEEIRYALNIFSVRLHLKAGAGNVFDVMAFSRDAYCTDSRDKVYSLLRVLKEMSLLHNSRLQIAPDYSKTIDEVYRNATCVLISQNSKVDLLMSLRSVAVRNEQLPSWVPDFRSNSGPTGLWMKGYIELYNYKATSGSQSRAHFEGNSACLHGHVVDRIVALSSCIKSPKRLGHADDDITRNPKVLSAIGRVMESQMAVCTQNGKYLPTEQTRRDAFYDTVTIYPGADHRLEEGLFNMVLEACAARGRPVPFVISVKRVLSCETFAHSTRLARIARGYYCNVPYATKVGDEIALLAGGSVPFVVRAFERAGKTRYKIWGGCYVHGIMYGEAWKPELVKEMWFD